MRLSIKLMLLTAAVVVVASLLLNAFFGRTLETFLIDHTRSGLIRQIRLATLLVSQQASQKNPDRIADELGDRLDVRVTIIDSGGVVLGDSQVDFEDLESLDNHGKRPEIQEAAAGGFGRSVRFSNTLGIDMLYVAGPVPDRQSMVLRLAIPMTELAATRATIQGVLWFSLLGGLLAVGGTSFGFSRLLIRHINHLSGYARRLAAGEFGQRVEIRGQSIPEIRDLARALNEMRQLTQERLEQIVAENSRLEAVLAGISEGIMVTEPNGRIRMTNSQFDRLFGMREGVNVGRMPIEVIRNPEVEAAVVETLRTSEVHTLEIETHGVLPRYLDVHTAPILQEGSCIGSVTVFYDISEIRRLEQIRKDFVANVSHELRTPLTTIKGCAATLADGALDDPVAARRFVDSINAHAGRLHSLVDDLLDLSHLEDDGLALDRETIDLAGLVYSARETVMPFARERKVTVESEVPPDIMVVGDEALLRQAVVNLLDNAIKYTEEGGTVRVYTRLGPLVDPEIANVPMAVPEPASPPRTEMGSAEDQGDQIYLEVSDSGIGIPSDTLSRVFERFYRVDKGRSRAMGGTGLGLAIVRHIVESHGERVFVRSELGIGSTFGFSLRLHAD